MRVLFNVMLLALVFAVGCGRPQTSDSIQREQQEVLLKEATSQVGMPSIKNFQERKILKDILELRDQEGLVTYTYLYNEMTGKLVFLGETIGFGIPYSTQFTSPEKLEVDGSNERHVMPQADPNGLFSPASADATWVLMKDPNGKDVKPVLIEPRIIVSPFKLKVE